MEDNPYKVLAYIFLMGLIGLGYYAYTQHKQIYDLQERNQNLQSTSVSNTVKAETAQLTVKDYQRAEEEFKNDQQKMYALAALEYYGRDYLKCLFSHQGGFRFCYKELNDYIESTNKYINTYDTGDYTINWRFNE